MTLHATVLIERISIVTSLRLLLFLIAIGTESVMYWSWSK